MRLDFSRHAENNYGPIHHTGRKLSWATGVALDIGSMLIRGDSKRLPLYLTDGDLTVSNWPGTLKFPVLYSRRGDHNMAGPDSRVDVWFRGPDGYVWHGTHIGHWNEIVHCRRTKERA